MLSYNKMSEKKHGNRRKVSYELCDHLKMHAIRRLCTRIVMPTDMEWGTKPTLIRMPVLNAINAELSAHLKRSSPKRNYLRHMKMTYLKTENFLKADPVIVPSIQNCSIIYRII